ncbi:MAG: bestrophin family protein, partial [Flavobacteriales bacterium]
MLLNKRIPLKYLFNKIGPDLTITFIVIISVVLIEETLQYDLSLPIAIPAFLGTSISLVLSFKLSQSYGRWWEARKIWGAIVNDSRSLVLQSKQFIKSNPELENQLKYIAYNQIAWCFTLNNALRKEKNQLVYNKYIHQNDQVKVEMGLHKPLRISDLLSQHFRTLKSKELLSDYQQIKLQSTLTNLVASMGKAERIKNTVFPITYRLFLRLFIHIFIFALVVSMSDIVSVSDQVKWIFESILVLIIILPFLLLEKTAYHIQDPFENRPMDTPTSAISKTIERNLLELIDEKLPEQEDESDHYYVL